MKEKLYKIKADNKPEFLPGYIVVVPMSKASKFKTAIVMIQYVAWDKAEKCWKYGFNGMTGEKSAKDILRLRYV